MSELILEILQSDVSPRDKVEKTIKLLDDKTNRLFAVDCARRALSKIEDPDPRSLKSVDIAEKYAYGKATDDELRAACNTAYSAAYDAYDADYASRSAAYGAAWSAAWSAAWNTNNAARSAPRAACSAACNTAYSAEDSNKEREIQIKWLIDHTQQKQHDTRHDNWDCGCSLLFGHNCEKREISRWEGVEFPIRDREAELIQLVKSSDDRNSKGIVW